MGLPKIAKITDREIEILLACLEPRSKQEVALKTGISFTYCEKRMTRLKNIGYLESAKINNSVKYRTVRQYDTEPLWMFANGPNAQKNVHEIMFMGRLQTLGEALSLLASERIRLKTNPEAAYRLLEVMRDCIAVVQNRSWRKDTKQHFQLPDEDFMKELLAAYIKQTENELELAKELYKKEFLWSGSETTWKYISDKEPSADSQKAYANASTIYMKPSKDAVRSIATNLNEQEKIQAKRMAELEKQWKEEGWE